MSPIQRVLLLRLRSTTTNYSTVATTTRKSSKSKLQKPTEIPFQPKLANSVNLIGTVNKPIHFQTSTDGNPSAATVITRLGHDPSQFLIPLFFHGDLALTAQFHLKLNDVVHVEGQLSTEDDQIKLDKPQQYQFQVCFFPSFYYNVTTFLFCCLFISMKHWPWYGDTGKCNHMFWCLMSVLQRFLCLQYRENTLACRHWWLFECNDMCWCYVVVGHRTWLLLEVSMLQIFICLQHWHRHTNMSTLVIFWKMA